MYKHLVVAVDGSETSVNALKHACSVAAAGKAKLTLVHVANPAEYMALAPEFLQQASYEEAAIANGNEVLSEAVEITNGAEPGISGVNTHLLLANKGAQPTGRGPAGAGHPRPHRPDAPLDGQLCRNRDAPKPSAAADYPQRTA